MSESEMATKGHGCMRVSVSIYSDLDSPTTPDEWRKALLLPDNYEVIQVERKESQDFFELTLLSEDIPVGEDIFIDPFYIALFDDNGSKIPQLDRIEMRRWNGEQWEDINCCYSAKTISNTSTKMILKRYIRH